MSEKFGTIIISRNYIERFQHFTYQYNYNFICVGCKKTLFHPHLTGSNQNQVDIYRNVRQQFQYLPHSLIVKLVFYANKVGVQRPSDQYLSYPFILPKFLHIKRRMRRTRSSVKQ